MTETNSPGTFVPQYEPQRALLDQFCKDNPDCQPRSASRTDDRPLASLLWSKGTPVMNWRAKDLGDSYVTYLTSEDIGEIAHAQSAYTGKYKGPLTASGKPLQELDKSSFPLPRVGSKLATIRRDLHHDLGISVLRGLDPSPWTMRESMVAFAGMASHVAQKRGRQAASKMIVHITDLGRTSSDGQAVARPAPYRNTSLPFHTDPAADVVAMFVLQAAAQGGQGVFCPVASICSDLSASYPGLLDELAKPDWPFDRPPPGSGGGTAATGSAGFYRRPVLFLDTRPGNTGTAAATGGPEMLFSRGALIQSPQGYRPDTLPTLDLRQNAALDALHFAAASNALRISYQPGDVLFFNNRRVLHGRDAFRDHDRDGRHARHLLRLWLADEELAGTPPPPLDRVWSNTFGDDDSGVVLADSSAAWPLAPDGS